MKVFVYSALHTQCQLVLAALMGWWWAVVGCGIGMVLVGVVVVVWCGDDGGGV